MKMRLIGMTLLTACLFLYGCDGGNKKGTGTEEAAAATLLLTPDTQELTQPGNLPIPYGPDTTVPTSGNGGSLTSSNVTSTSVRVNWTQATDDISLQSNLEYLLYYSAADNIQTLTDTETNGTAVGTWNTAITYNDVTGLSPSTTYYFNVVVKDEAGNKQVYASSSQITAPDAVAPTVSNGTLTYSAVGETSVTVNWTAGSDDITATVNLEYQVYQSTSNNINTLNDVASGNGTLVMDWTANTTQKVVGSLSPSTAYYFLVVVRDEAGNETAYTSSSQTTAATPDTTAPTVGTADLTYAGLTQAGVTVNWNKATDDVSAQTALQYRVYYSTSNNITNLTEIDANGTVGVDWTTDVATGNVTGLTSNTTYYLNVVVRDEAGNRTAYTSSSQTTGVYRIYLATNSNAAYSGNLGGFTGADNKCNSDPAKPAGSGTWKAYLYGQHLLKPNTAYYRADGTTLIATTDASGNMPNNLVNSINNLTWGMATGFSGANCNNWTTADNGWTGGFGTASFTDSLWRNGGSTTCGSALSIYCVEQ